MTAPGKRLLSLPQSRPAGGGDGHEPRTVPGLFRHYLRDLIYGANDGIVTTFAVVAGVAGAHLSERIVLILGMANLVADGFSMGASNYLAIRSHEAAREAVGLVMEEPYALRHGLATFSAFLIAGAIPLVAYLPVWGTPDRFVVSSALSVSALFAIGAARSLVTSRRGWTSGLEMLAVGTLAGAVAYLVGHFVAALTGLDPLV
ncbi:MAG: VIT1/CCC1 transporter family protein [Gemmatimonadetes bacterium]|nr:VIT1/CCC1 transporter family protein [Gemmatimonadota bacterium]